MHWVYQAILMRLVMHMQTAVHEYNFTSAEKAGQGFWLLSPPSVWMDDTCNLESEYQRQMSEAACSSSFWQSSFCLSVSHYRGGNFIECPLCQDIGFSHPSQKLCVIFDSYLSLCAMPISYETPWGGFHGSWLALLDPWVQLYFISCLSGPWDC